MGAQAGPYTPHQLHLSFGSQGASSCAMWVMWVSENQTVSPTVAYGSSAGNLNSVASGVSSQYYSTTDLSFSNLVSLTNLVYDAKYFYQVGSSATGLSAVFSFNTPPQALRPFTAAVYGDMGTLYGNVTRAALIANAPSYEWVFHLGDIAYSGISFTVWFAFLSS
ncbi:MAG: metallophosphoesterase family protein [archaeon]|nr:metallophosphoesterase family protein [archaeon]